MLPPTGTRHAIARVHADDFARDIQRFYTEHAHQPVIVQGVLDDNPFLRALDQPAVEKLLHGCPLWAFDCATLKKGEYVPAEVLFADMHAGRARWNVVDHSLLETPFAGRFLPPPFLRHNWFEQSGFDTNRFVMSVNCSTLGSFSPIHVDPYGMQGWMCLLFGRKRWRLYPPPHIPLIYDMTQRTFFHARQHEPAQFPLLPYADFWEGEIGPGEFLFFPAGWPHEVVTLEASFGLGGALVNDFQVLESTRSWLWEYAQSGPGDVDFIAFLQKMAAERPLAPTCQTDVQKALELHEKFVNSPAQTYAKG